jgi:hypothetical protein
MYCRFYATCGAGKRGFGQSVWWGGGPDRERKWRVAIENLKSFDVARERSEYVVKSPSRHTAMCQVQGTQTPPPAPGCCGPGPRAGAGRPAREYADRLATLGLPRAGSGSRSCQSVTDASMPERHRCFRPAASGGRAPDQWLLRDSPRVSMTSRNKVAGSRQAPDPSCPTIER